MSGTVIRFPGSRAEPGRSLSTPKPHRRDRKLSPRARAQIERIADLLEEIEAMSDHSRDLLPAMQARVRDSIYQAAQFVELRDLARSAPVSGEDEGDPQPHVDHEALERFYR
jgi:hypothetical protein